MSKHQRIAWVVLCATCLLSSAITVAAETAAPSIRQLQARWSANPNDVANLQRLAESLLLRARTQPDARDAAQAEAWIKRALRLAPEQAKSWELQAWQELNRHRFRQALAALDQALQIAPLSARGLGLQADALVELGRYDEAQIATQMLLDQHPGLPAYRRAAHLRFLHGDTPGAIELMQRAVTAGHPRAEETIAALLQLSGFYLQDGQLDLAEKTAQDASEMLPSSAASAAQLGRVRIAQGDLKTALDLYQKAARQQLKPEYSLAIYDLAQRLQLPAETRRQVTLLNAMARQDEKDGGLNRRLFAQFYAEQPGRARDAERLARLEIQTRPDIYSADTLAWVLYRQGKFLDATQLMQQALKLGTLDLALRQHAHTIFSAVKFGCG